MNHRIRKSIVVAAAFALLSTVAACQSPGTTTTAPPGETPVAPAELETVQVALQPLHQYAMWQFGETSGMAADLGLKLEFTWLAQVDTAVQGLSRGDLDMISTCTACNFPFLAQAPNLRDALIISQFKGFILIGHAGAPSYNQLVADGKSSDEARAEVHAYLKGRTFVLREAVYGALLNGMLEYAGLTRDDVEVLDVADDSRAGQAFLQGGADFYMGSLAQESKLLREYPDRVVNMGGTEILGPGGLWYDTMAVNAEWLDQHPETILKLAALWSRIVRYMESKPEQIMPIVTESINEHSGSSFDEGEIELLLEEFLGFATLDKWENEIFNPESQLYWRNSLEFYAQQNVRDGVLAADLDVNSFYIYDDIYKQLMERQDLLDWINAPLT